MCGDVAKSSAIFSIKSNLNLLFDLISKAIKLIN